MLTFPTDPRKPVVFCLLLGLFTCPVAALERPAGTPRVARDFNRDRSGGGFFRFASSSADTTILGTWRFDAGPTCDPQGWVSVDLTSDVDDFGDFAGLERGIEQVQRDACAKNLECLWAFITGSNNTYACGGSPSQAAVPFGDESTGYIWNEIWSPEVSLTGTGSQIDLRFNVYRELDLRNLVFYTWRVRSASGPTIHEWKTRNNLYYSYYGGKPNGDWLTQVESIGDLIEPGADRIQVALGVVDMGGAWSGTLGDGACHSNAPLFDSIAISRVAVNGPQWSVEPIDLFQDNFASDGTVTGTVRIDIARDINPRDNLSIRPGDSVVVSVGEPTVGLGLHSPGVPGSGPAVYLHARDVSAQKSGEAVSGNPTRWPVVSNSGGWTVLRFDSVRTPFGTVAGRYCVDLNDELYTPGDMVEFYFSARDVAGRTTYWTEYGGTTATQDRALSSPMEVTCLPTLNGEGRAILYVDDADGSGAQPYFELAFSQLALSYDRFDVRGPDCLAGNGPGSRVRNVQAQLTNVYDSIIWSTGELAWGLVGDGTGAPEKSPDAQMLVDYLEYQRSTGFLYLTGDNLATELSRLASPAASALRNFIDYSLVSDAHRPTSGVSPIVQGTPFSVFQSGLGTPHTHIAFGGCPRINQFDVLAAGPRSIVEAEYATSSLGAIVGQTTPTSTGQCWVLLSGFGFEYIRDDEQDGILDLSQHLSDILSATALPFPCGTREATIASVDEGVQVSWDIDPCGELLGIRVYRAFPSDPAPQLIHETHVPPRIGSYLDTNLGLGERAQYHVEGILTRGRTSLIDSATVFRSVPVSEFSAVARDFGVSLSWQVADPTGLAGFATMRRPWGAIAFERISGDSLLAPETRGYFDTSFEPGTTYDYQLSMHYAGGEIVESAVTRVVAPNALALDQNSPNPFNPSTRIRFMIPEAGQTEIIVYDVRGTPVRTILTGSLPAGFAEASWDGRNEDGAPAASGIYFYRLSAVGQTMTRKMVLLR